MDTGESAAAAAARWQQVNRSNPTVSLEQFCGGDPARVSAVRAHLATADLPAHPPADAPTADWADTRLPGGGPSGPADPLRSVGGYEVLGELGRGGMGSCTGPGTSP